MVSTEFGSQAWGSHHHHNSGRKLSKLTSFTPSLCPAACVSEAHGIEGGVLHHHICCVRPPKNKNRKLSSLYCYLFTQYLKGLQRETNRSTTGRRSRSHVLCQVDWNTIISDFIQYQIFCRLQSVKTALICFFGFFFCKVNHCFCLNLLNSQNSVFFVIVWLCVLTNSHEIAEVGRW